MNRRLFLRALAATGVIMNPWYAARSESGLLPKTPRDYEGPYYPVGPRNQTSDLILGEPRDRVLNFSGQIVDVQGNPLVNAVFDFWHADPLGRYKHPRDRSDGERWPDFLYWGEAQSSDEGRFELRTYVPGDYGRRPPHIHFKIRSNEKTLLTSQVYFAELGGPRGASRSNDALDRQTVSLVDDGGKIANAELQIVV